MYVWVPSSEQYCLTWTFKKKLKMRTSIKGVRGFKSRRVRCSFILVLISNFFFYWPVAGGIMEGSIAHFLVLIHTLNIILNWPLQNSSPTARKPKLHTMPEMSWIAGETSLQVTVTICKEVSSALKGFMIIGCIYIPHDQNVNKKPWTSCKVVLYDHKNFMSMLLVGVSYMSWFNFGFC